MALWLPTWRFGLWDLDGVFIGEVLNAGERRWTRKLNGLDTASFRIRLDNPMAKEIIDREGDVLCGVYQVSDLRFMGELVTAEESGQGYRRVWDREGLVTRGYSLPAIDFQMGDDTDAIAARGLFEEVIPSDLNNTLLRKSLVDAHVAVRKQARQIITFEPGASDGSETLQCNFAGPLWRLQKRLAVQETTPVAATTSSRATHVQGAITQANGDHDTGVRIGTVSAPDLITVEGWSFKPVSEILTEISAAPVIPYESPSSYTASDLFDTGSGALHGRTADNGGTWTSTGTTANDFNVSGGLLGRGPAVTDDGPLWTDGRFARLGPDHTDLIVQVNYLTTGPYVSSSRWSGLLFRYKDADEFAFAFVDFTTSTPGLWLAYHDASGFHGLHSVALYGFGADSGYTLRVQMDEEGQYAVWHHTAGSQSGGPMIAGQDDVFATGGNLETGKLGLYHRNDSQSGTEIFDGFLAAELTQSVVAQGVDFELVPTEPTADTDQDGVVGAGLQIAEFNMPAAGTVQEHAVFEHGTGNPNRPDYGAYEVGDYVTGRAKDSNGNSRFNARFRIYGVELTIDDEDKETLIPQLVPE